MSQRVLIVDDAVALHKLICSHLAGESLELHSVYDGESALSTIPTLRPALVLLDVDMPGINGFEVCRRLKVSEATHAIPIIFLTASASSEAKLLGFDLHAMDYITKPFDPTDLRARVRVALRTKLLLDLIPGQRAGVAGEGAPRTRALSGSRINARLKFTDLLAARGANPWNRVAPEQTVIIN